MRRRELTFVMLFFLQSLYASSQDFLLARGRYEPENLDPVYAVDLPPEIGTLSSGSQFYVRSVRDFLSGMNVVSGKIYRKLDGKWILDKVPALDGRLCLFVYEIPEITINRNRENIPVIRAPYASVLYQNRSGTVYFKTYVWGVLEKLVVSGKRIYLYHLNHDIWELDTVYRKGNFWENVKK